MDYSAIFKIVLKEAFECKQYKRLAPVSRVFGFIAVLPFIILSVALSIAYAVSVFTFNLLSTGVRYLEEWVKKTKTGVSTPTEAVIYLVTTPTIFMFQVCISFLSSMFFIIWFLMQCAFYISTLGGTKWRPYTTNINLEDSLDNYMVTTNAYTAGTSVVIIGAVYIIYLILSLVNLIEPYTIDADFVSILSLVHSLAACITIPIVFRKALLTDGVYNNGNEENDDFELPEL